MKTDFSEAELSAASMIIQDLLDGRENHGIERLRALKEEIHAAIPEKLRIGRGITWVVERISLLLATQGHSDEKFRNLALSLYPQLKGDELLIGVSIFLMAEYGMRHPMETFGFFETAAQSGHWVVREFAAGAFRRIVGPNKDVVLPWLQKMARTTDPNQRRFASETLRPVTFNKWINQQPEYSLSVLMLLFKENHPYPRTSVGNNLSDLSRRQPELIFGVVKDLEATGDKNSYWIAYRACRNLVKKEPQRVMNLLRVEEYHYKDRNFYKKESLVLESQEYN
jgi:3-methyladenine DNA glycosylase AlkC